jgi:hypothetical protein
MSPEHEDPQARETPATEDQDPDAEPPRQRIVRVAGSRRVKLTPAPGAQEEPVETDDDAGDAASVAGEAPTGDRPGPNDERMRRDVPPHW